MKSEIDKDIVSVFFGDSIVYGLLSWNFLKDYAKGEIVYRFSGTYEPNCMCMYIIYATFTIYICGNIYFHKTIRFKLSNRDIICSTLLYLEKMFMCVLKMHFNASLY